MTRDLRRGGQVAAVVALAAALTGCGGDDAPRPPVVVVTPAPVRGVISQTSFSGFESDVWVSLPFTLSQRGVLDVTVDWTSPDTWMYVYFGRQGCTYFELAGRTCPFLISSETQAPKPRVLVTEALDPGTYYLVLYNVPRDPRTGIGSDNTESVSIQLGLTVSASGQRSTGAVRLGQPTVLPAPRLGPGA
jgi:hypothetical protein